MASCKEIVPPVARKFQLEVSEVELFMIKSALGWVGNNLNGGSLYAGHSQASFYRLRSELKED